MLTIALDAMGGDLGPRVAFGAIEKLLRKNPDVALWVFLERQWVKDASFLLKLYPERIRLVGCGSSIAADEKPSVVLKGRQDSSMAKALESYRSGETQGVLSVGSTGALMMLSRRLLGLLPGVDRPALATQIPTRNKPLLMLDLGASLHATSAQLVQFAVLGLCWCKAMKVSMPRIGLLNVGHESGKGTSEIRDAGEKLKRLMPNEYIGFREGDDLYAGDLDVMVCDGFTGNVALKTSEGLTEWITWLVRKELRAHWLLGLLTPVLRQTFKRIHQRIAPSRHSGAVLLGVDGVVAKTHGKSDASTYEYALQYLVQQARCYDRDALMQQIAPMQKAIA